MKAQVLVVTLAAAAVLSACGKKEEHTYAVDKVEEAQAAALEKAPKAEPMKFDDEGQPKFGFPADGSAPAPAADAAATDTAAAPAADAQATDAAAAPATDAAAAPADAVATEEKK